MQSTRQEQIDNVKTSTDLLLSKVNRQYVPLRMDVQLRTSQIYCTIP